MVQKVKIGDEEYDLNPLSEAARKNLSSYQFVTKQIEELTNLQALLQRAKNSYMESLKSEIITAKSGLVIEDD